MLALPIYALLAGLTIWGLFKPSIAAIPFISIAIVFAFWLLLVSFTLRSKTIRHLNMDEVSPAEVAILRKHMLYFVYPFQAQQYSSAFSFIQALSLVWICLFLWHREWLLLVFFVGVFFAAASMASFVHPGAYLRHRNAQAAVPDYLQERLELLKVVEAKVLEARRAANQEDRGHSATSE